MKKSISANYIYNLIYQILILLVPLITTPYISRVLSVNGIGIYSFTYSIAYFFSLLAELGSVTYARREIAYCQDDRSKRSKIFWEILIIRTFTTVISSFIYMIYIIQSDFFIIGIIQMIYIISVVFDITWFFQGMEDFKTVVIRNSIVKIVIMIFIFTFVKTENDLILYILGLSILPLFGNLVTWTSLPKYIDKVSIKELKPFNHLKDMFILFIPNIASQVYLLLDKTMLGLFTVDNIENGYYEQAQKIIKICWTFLTTFSMVMAPRIAYVYGKKDKESLRKYMCKSFNIVWFISTALVFGIISVSGNIVPWFLGDNYNKVIDLLIIFSFILYPIGITSVIGTQYLVTIKKQKIYTISIVVGAIINVFMNYFLIPKYYSIGAAISSVTAEGIIALIQIVYIVYYIREIKMKDIFSYLWQYTLAGIIMFIIVKKLSLYLNANILNTAILIIIGAVIYFIILIVLRNKLMLEGIKRVKEVLLTIRKNIK